ncbi:high-affinity choline transporter 1-like [Pseudonaja textilis]|uniref:high-affinity choline transporter 1-like n=1 Tax=Pseudonaja textilis TaxID=8673 RepID=UPI000EAA703B|nr:high-affinity choline transporter 1-like [Pseudonaja textilis]
MALNISGLVALLLFYALTLAIGIWASRKTRQKEQQKPSEVAMVGGRNMNFCIGLFTATATWVGGAYINGTAEIVYLPSRGLVWVQAPVGFALSLLVGATMKVILDIQGYIAIILSACTVILYTLLGGLYSVAYTDVIQLIFISLSLWICIPFAIMNPATENIFHTATHNISQAPWTGKIEPEFYGRWFDDFLYLVLGAIPWQTYFQRVLAASSHKEARLISYFSGLGCFIMAIPSVLIGAVAASTDWNQTDYGLPTPYERNESALILPLVLQHLCPMYISVGGLGAIAAAVMSSGDSALLSAGSMFAHNIYRKIFRRKATEKEVLWAMRISMVVFGIISALLAFYSSSIFDLWFLSGELVYTLLFPQLCCALFLSSTNTYGSMVGFFLGFLLRLLAGEPSLKIPPVICYPGCSVVEGISVQLFPFKMVTMLVTLFTIFSTSHLASFMFKSRILPAEWDVCQVTMDARMPVPFSREERQMEKIQNCEQVEEAVMKDI